MTLAASHLWLIPACPLLAAAIASVTPRGGRRLAAGCAVVAMTVASLLSALAVSAALADPAAHQYSNFLWMQVGDQGLRLGWLLDPLTALMCLMVSFVGLLIFIFSLGYMKDDANFTRFFCFLSLFAAAMLGLLVSNSLLLLFICWELVGLASYLLIGFWFHKPAAAAAAKKAFLTTRIGDLGFLIGLVWLQNSAGTLLCYNGGAGFLESGALAKLAGTATASGIAVSTAIALLLFCGAIGKSGQFPLHVWLPDAMEGPTPVSALIHAATMVAAGVFLVARVFPLMSADLVLPAEPFHALTVVAAIGAITALIGSAIAVAQSDIKRILAFSTVSQLGYMMLALGVGAPGAAIFHLLTHACFKALLFLGAGSVIHAAHHEQDIRQLGGLRKPLRVTFATFAIGMMALSGVPFLFSGFWSKEAILHAAHGWIVSPLPYCAALVAVVLTAFYMTRLMAEVFFGGPRSHAAEEAHESPAVMTLPLVVLAILTIGLGFLGTPVWPWLQARIEGVELHGHPMLEGSGLLVLSIVLVGAGLGAGWWVYGIRPRRRAESADPLAQLSPRTFGALAARLGFDELYAATVGRGNTALAVIADGLDRWVWSAAVALAAKLGEFVGLTNRDVDEDMINGGFDTVSESFRGAGRRYSRFQSGDAHGYLRVVAMAFAILGLLALWGVVR